MILLLTFLASAAMSFADNPNYRRIDVSDKFRSEGGAFGDFNRDGVMDLVAGQFWYEGPEYQVSHPIFETEDHFDPESYSNSFVVYTGDFNGDGWTDILICPHPGVTGYWYENPQGKDELWPAHETTVELGNESQRWGDVDGDGQPDLVFNRIGYLGYISYDTRKPYEPWKFTAVSGQDDKYQRYYHGNGLGDINGDGRVDILEKDGWWEHPEQSGADWKFHAFPFAEAASDILCTDVDGDGLNDVITAIHCHLYGLSWWKQVRNENGEIGFEENVLIPREPGDDFFPKVSQLHSMELADMNGDGRMDFVTGKRWWAHGSTGDIATNDPAILMWWENHLNEDGTVTFIPHIIDENSGVGTQVTVQDINGDQVPDILVVNKKGTVLFVSEP